MHPGTAVDGPTVTPDGVSFVLADRPRRLARVSLVQEIALGDLRFTRDRGGWRLDVPRPPVDRMEYLFEIEDHNGHRATITDPANPLRAPGAFGEKSTVLFPEYRAPIWLDAPEIDSAVEQIEIDAPLLDGVVSGTVWSPAGLTGTAPLVVVHDGPEYAALAGFTRYLAAGIAVDLLPPVRCALLSPGERNSWYAADERYARTLADQVLPAVERDFPSTMRVGVGVSLGALAMLHAHRGAPDTFDALMLQSGSFFVHDLDAQECQFTGFEPVTEFVAAVHAAGTDPHPVPTAMTCGVVEENLANNRRMADTLTRLGYPTALATVRDAHNYTAWRDALHPQLSDLLTGLVIDGAA